MYLSIKRVKPLDKNKLELTFENNEVRIFDVEPYMDTGVFYKLRDDDFFKMVKISFDTIGWPGGIDLDPEVLYEKSAERKERIIGILDGKTKFEIIGDGKITTEELLNL